MEAVGVRPVIVAAISQTTTRTLIAMPAARAQQLQLRPFVMPMKILSHASPSSNSPFELTEAVPSCNSTIIVCLRRHRSQRGMVSEVFAAIGLKRSGRGGLNWMAG